MMLRKVPLALTEEALGLLAATYADFTTIAQVPVPGRITTTGSLGPYDFRGVRFESAYLRLICILEAYVDLLCSKMFRQHLVGQPSIFRHLVYEAEMRASANWDERKSAFSGAHKVRLTSCSSWSDVDAGIEVRNAIAHGLGGLTARQRNGKHREKLAKVGVLVVDERVLIDEKALKRCLRYASDFVRSLDAAIPR
jgi:hypothetical protein